MEQKWNKNWCINIECKIADAWSLKDLYKAIDKQLIDQYLKYPKYQHGILLISRIFQQSWKAKNRKTICFGALIELLQEYADKTKLRHEHIKDIKVIGIDYYYQSRKKVKK